MFVDIALVFLRSSSINTYEGEIITIYLIPSMKILTQEITSDINDDWPSKDQMVAYNLSIKYATLYKISVAIT